jgi:hypothetical protein
MALIVVALIVSGYFVLARHGTTSARTLWRTDGPITIAGREHCAAAEPPVTEQAGSERWAICAPSAATRKCLYEVATARPWRTVPMASPECQHAYTVLHDNGLVG